MKTTKWILTCVLAASMTAATICAQKDAPEDMDIRSAELDQLVDLAEMDLLADMIESLLREEENADSNSVADSRMPEGGPVGVPGMNIDYYGGGFGMGNMGGFGGFPMMDGFGGMGGFGDMGGFGGFPMMGGFGGMVCFCTF